MNHRLTIISHILAIIDHHFPKENGHERVGWVGGIRWMFIFFQIATFDDRQTRRILAWAYGGCRDFEHWKTKLQGGGAALYRDTNQEP